MRTRLPILLLTIAILAAVFIPNAFAQGAPAAVTDLRAERSGTSVILTWTHSDSTVDHYEVWWSDSPYAAPGDPGMVHIADVTPGVVGAAVTYTDTASGVGNPAVNSATVARSGDRPQRAG